MLHRNIPVKLPFFFYNMCGPCFPLGPLEGRGRKGGLFCPVDHIVGRKNQPLIKYIMVLVGFGFIVPYIQIYFVVVDQSSRIGRLMSVGLVSTRFAHFYCFILLLSVSGRHKP